MTDEIGDLFAPQPGRLYGNIRCMSDSETRIIGYISAGTRSVKRIFATKEEVGIYVPFSTCPPMNMQELFGTRPTLPTRDDFYGLGFRPVGLSIFSLVDSRDWYPKECVDCTTRGTKNKPSFWPNDHF